MKRLLATLAVGFAVASGAHVASADAPRPVAHAAAHTCADYPNQAAAQRAADTRDANHDGIYCNDLPCPCSAAAGGDTDAGSSNSSATATATPKPSSTAGTCTTPAKVQELWFSAAKYPHIREHYLVAVRKGWPQILVLDRPGADARRSKLLADIPTKAGYDRDEYPPAIGRGRYRKALEIGTDPTGWQADFAYVGSGENRSHGAAMGALLRPFCNGTKFRYRFR